MAMMPTTVHRSDTQRAVSKEVWLHQNSDFLHDLYELIRNANESTGRRAFDRLSLAQWCDLAYKHSTIYEHEDAYMYDDTERDLSCEPNDDW